MRRFLPFVAVLASAFAPSRSLHAASASVRLTVQADAPGKPISPDLFGIFFEDLNYAADGGLYAELVQNRSFEYQSTERFDWNSFTGWEFVRRGGGTGKISVEDSRPVHPNNPHYIVLDVDQPADGVGVMNAGFDTIPVQAGASYNFSVFARQLFVGRSHTGVAPLHWLFSSHATHTPESAHTGVAPPHSESTLHLSPGCSCSPSLPHAAANKRASAGKTRRAGRNTRRCSITVSLQ